MEQQFLSDIKRAYETAQKQADELRKKVELPANDTQPTGGGDADVDAIMQALKGKPKTP
jgi:archaellum component FlaC